MHLTGVYFCAKPHAGWDPHNRKEKHCNVKVNSHYCIILYRAKTAVIKLYHILGLTNNHTSQMTMLQKKSTPTESYDGT